MPPWPCVRRARREPGWHARVTPPLTVFRSSPVRPHFYSQLDAQAAVDRLAANVAVHIAEHDSAVYRVRVDAAAYVLDDDAAVGGIDSDVGFPRHLQLVRHRPVPIVVPVAGAASTSIPRTVGVDPSAGRGDLDVLGDALSGVAAVVPHRDACASCTRTVIREWRPPVPDGVRSTVMVFRSVPRALTEVARRSWRKPLVLDRPKLVASAISLSG